MNDIKWFNDQAAKRVHGMVESSIKDMCERMFPDHLFTHLGISRNDHTNEILLRVHLRPIGEAMIIRERFNYLDTLKLGVKP